MRLDKFMQLSRIVKRRSLAEALCREGLVWVNDKTAKPSYRVKEGDRIKVRLGKWLLEYKVLSVPTNKKVSPDYVELISRQEVMDQW